MIYQSGYLTIKDYDKFTHSYLLDIPNNEVREGLLMLGVNFSSEKGTIARTL